MPKRNKQRPPAARSGPAADDGRPIPLRIVGGSMRGRKLAYSGRLDTRPMKDRVREATFNLIGPAVVGMHAIDLFAGTGAIGLEAISRGAAQATFVERHVPTAKIIRENIAALEVIDRCEVQIADAILWIRQPEKYPPGPWLVFISPPWELFVSQGQAMLEMISRTLEAAPVGSMLVVEADERFDINQLPCADQWRLRAYPPAVIGIFHKHQESPSDEADAGEAS